jgi:hypothetical protein
LSAISSLKKLTHSKAKYVNETRMIMCTLFIVVLACAAQTSQARALIDNARDASLEYGQYFEGDLKIAPELIERNYGPAGRLHRRDAMDDDARLWPSKTLVFR